MRKRNAPQDCRGQPPRCASVPVCMRVTLHSHTRRADTFTTRRTGRSACITSFATFLDHLNLVISASPVRPAHALLESLTSVPSVLHCPPVNAPDPTPAHPEDKPIAHAPSSPKASCPSAHQTLDLQPITAHPHNRLTASQPVSRHPSALPCSAQPVSQPASTQPAPSSPSHHLHLQHT